jgi:hypothetical protein
LIFQCFIQLTFCCSIFHKILIKSYLKNLCSNLQNSHFNEITIDFSKTLYEAPIFISNLIISIIIKILEIFPYFHQILNQLPQYLIVFYYKYSIYVNCLMNIFQEFFEVFYCNKPICYYFSIYLDITKDQNEFLSVFSSFFKSFINHFYYSIQLFIEFNKKTINKLITLAISKFINILKNIHQFTLN